MYDVIVVGAGGMGSAAAYHAASRGARVLALERHAIPNDLGSSHGFSRIIRLAYWEHSAYVPLVLRAYELWQQLESAAGERLLVVTGSVDAGAAGSVNVVGARDACRTFRLEYEELDSAGLTARFPGYRLPHDAVAIYQPAGGFLRPERCITSHVELARRGGADIRPHERVLAWDASGGGVRVRTESGTYDGRRLILAAGAWTSTLVATPAAPLSPERQVMLWTAPAKPALFDVAAFPVFYVTTPTGPFYGFPSHDGHGFKIGRYGHLHQQVDPDTMDRGCHPDDEALLRDGIRRYFPDADGPTLAMKTCLFTNTADEHFVVDRLPDLPHVAIAAGFSGHGFKFCSVVGEILADLVLDGGTRHDIALFSLSRPRIASQ
jgi:sarcosine oxidase